MSASKFAFSLTAVVALSTAACGDIDAEGADPNAAEPVPAGDIADDIVETQQALTAPGYLAVWQAGLGAQWWYSGLTDGEFVQKDNSLFPTGYRIKSIDVYTFTQSCGLGCTEPAHRYTVVWEQGSGAQWVHWGMTNSQFVANANAYYAQGLRVKALAVSSTGRITAVWRPGTGGERVWAGITSSKLASEDAALWSQGFQMNQLVGYDGKYYAEWGPKVAGAVYWRTAMSSSTFTSTSNSFFNQGLRIVSLDLRSDKYHAIYQGNQGTGAQWVSSGLTPEQMTSLDQQYFKQGLRLRTLRVRKYDLPDQSGTQPPSGGGMAPPPSGEACTYWATAEVRTCYNVDGSPSTIVRSGSVTAAACASTLTRAKTAAKANLATAIGCLSETATAGCCTYGYR